MQTELRLTLLGTPQVWLNHKVVQGFRTLKTQALFYYLAVTRRAHTRSALATLLWGDMPERNALVSLSKSLSNLRDLFPAHLEIERHYVAFNSQAPYWLDVATFEAGFDDSHRLAQTNSHHLSSLHPHSLARSHPHKEANHQHLRQVADLYHGDFLAGFAVNNAPDFDAWQSTESQRLRELAIHGLDALAKGYAAAGNWLEAIGCCRKILTLEPWREEAHRQLMLLLLANGERTAALVQYDHCIRTLEDELAVEPEAETSELYEDIVAGTIGVEEASSEWKAQALPVEQASGQRNVAHHLPPLPHALIGREHELATLRQLAHDPSHRLLTLLGPGGVGKTSLALACAESLASDFGDGVWYVSFAGVDTQTASDSRAMAEAKLSAILVDALGISFSSPRPPEREIANFLQKKHLLLVLDNFDPFVRVAPLIARWLGDAPTVHCLVTSREALQLVEEVIIPVTNMAVPDLGRDVGEGVSGISEAELGRLMGYASMALFVQNAQRLQSDFRLTPENAGHIVHICRDVDGLPLGIELAATWLNTLAPNEIAEELARGLDLLDAPPLHVNGDAHRPTGIRAVFEYSWQLLSPQECRCAAQFSVFQGGTSREAILWVTEAALPQLSALINKSILRRNGAGRYEMHQLLRHYCAEKLVEEYDASVTHTRHSTYYLMLVQEREKTIKRRDAKQLIQEMRLELDNIRQAWRWAVEEGNIAVLQRTLTGYARLYALVGLYEEASTTLEWSVNELRQREANLVTSPEAYQLFCEVASCMLSHAAAFLNRQALFDRAIILAQAAQQSLQEMDLPISRAQALLRWGEAYWYQGRMAEAKPFLEQVMELTSRASLLDVGPQELRADALCLQGSTAVRLGGYKEAIHCYESSLHISRALQDAYREGRALHSLGTTFRNQGHFGEARSYLEQGLQLSRQIGDMHSESRSLNSLGDIAYYLGDYMDAQRSFSQVRDIAVSMGDRRSESIALTNLGIIARDLGRYDHARELLTQGLYVAREIGFRRGEAWALVCLSLLLHQHHKESAALDRGQQGLRIFEELGDDVGQAYAWTEIGHALAALQELDKAEEAYGKALVLRRTLAQPHLEMEVLAGLMRVDLARQKLDEANRKAEQLLAYLQSSRLLGVEEPVLVYWSCALALLDDRLAEKVLNDAKRMLEERAAAIDDNALRSSFLQIEAHRTLLRAKIPTRMVRG